MHNLLILRSSDREDPDNTFSHDCRLKLSQPLEAGVYKLVSAVLPQTVLTLQMFKSDLFFYRHGSTLQHESHCVLQQGYYDVMSLCDALQSAMNAKREAQNPGESYTFTVTYDAVIGRVRIGSTGTRVQVNSGMYNMNSILGVVPGQQSAAGGVLIGQRLVDLVGATRSTQINLMDGEGGAVLDSRGRNSTFVLLPDVNSMSQYLYSEKTGVDQFWTVRSRTKEVKVTILDAEFNALNLQNADWLICLRRVCG